MFYLFACGLRGKPNEKLGIYIVEKHPEYGGRVAVEAEKSIAQVDTLTQALAHLRLSRASAPSDTLSYLPDFSISSSSPRQLLR